MLFRLNNYKGQDLIEESKAFTLQNGQTLGYRVCKGEKTPIVLVHGAGSSMKVWDPVISKLTEKNRYFLTVDLPGHGASCTKNGKYRPEEAVNAIQELLEYENITKTHLVGHSLGGALVVGLAEKTPDNITSVTLVAAGGLGREVAIPLRAATLPGSDKVLSLAFSKPVINTLTETVAALERKGFTTGTLQEDIESLNWLSDESRRRAFLSTLCHVVGPIGQRMSILERLQQHDSKKYLVIWGTRDTMLPAKHAIAARKVLPKAKLKLFVGAGHEPHTYDPTLFTETLLEHVEQLEEKC